MAATLSPLPFLQFFYPGTTTPIAGGKLWTYAAGTTTPQATYTDASGSTAAPNPITLDANGQCQLWLKNGLSYKLNLLDSVGAQIVGWPVDNVVQNLEVLAHELSTNLATPLNGMGTDMVNYLAPYIGAVGRNLRYKLSEQVSVFDFMTSDQVADVKARTKTIDVSACLQNAIDAAGDYANATKIPVTLYLPAGAYKITTRIHMRPYTQIRGDGMGRTVIYPYLSSGPAFGSDATLGAEEAYLVHHQGFMIDGTNCTGTAYAWYFKNNKNSTFTQIGFWNFSAVSAGNPAVNIDGACYGLRFVQCQWNLNKSHLKSVGIDATTNFSTTCIFDGCNFEGGQDLTQTETSSGIFLKDVLHFQFQRCIIQGNMNYETIRISALNSSFGEHLIKDCWFEGNGTNVLPENSGSGVANSSAISIAGVAGKLVTGCIIDGNVFHQAYTNVPNYQIRLQYTDKTRITDNREGFGGTFVKDSGNNTNVWLDTRSTSAGEFGNPYAPAAWVVFDGKTGGVATIKNSFNVASVVRNSTGNYTITFTKALKANYAVNVTGEDGAATGFLIGSHSITSNTASVTVATLAPVTGAVNDARTCSVVIYSV